MLVSKIKKLFPIPIIIFFLALTSLVVMQLQTGSYVGKGLELTGGRLITIEFEGNVDQIALENQLEKEFGDISVRVAESVGTRILLVQTSISANETEVVDAVTKEVTVKDASFEEIGTALGETFWSQTQLVILFALVLMAIAVFIFFRKPVPSGMVVFNVFSDVVITIAVMNLLNIKLSLAGLAGILMIIGYSDDTNILLMINVLKSLEEDLNDRISRSMKTGLMMTLTTLASLFCLYFISVSPVLSEIALILIIGLLVDTMNTWIVNTGLLIMWLGKHEGIA